MQKLLYLNNELKKENQGVKFPYLECIEIFFAGYLHSRREKRTCYAKY
jgi:hypothetical protein